MELHDHLRTLGLNASEIRIYLFLLGYGLATPSQIAKGTKTQRPNTYHVINSLMEKGLVMEQKNGKRNAYLTSDPESLLAALEHKKNIVEAILPDLRGLRSTQRNKPTIQYFDGLSQIQEIYQMTLQGKEIIALGSTDRLYQLMPKFVESWLENVKSKGIVLRDIVTHLSGDAAAHKMIASLKGYYDAKVLPQSAGEFTTDILIWDDHLALITLEEPYFGTVITNSSLVNTFRQVLDLLRDSLPKA